MPNYDFEIEKKYHPENFEKDQQEEENVDNFYIIESLERVVRMGVFIF